MYTNEHLKYAPINDRQEIVHYRRRSKVVLPDQRLLDSKRPSCKKTHFSEMFLFCWYDRKSSSTLFALLFFFVVLVERPAPATQSISYVVTVIR